MKIISLLSRLNLKTFKISYSPEYKTFLPHQIAYDKNHPLHILRRRELNVRKQEGLWWHVTSGVDLSKSSVVRTWCRRRLRNAFTEGLKDRGFDEYGRLVDADILTREHKDLERILDRNKEFGLTGSVRLHITPALVAAKFADVKKEASSIVNILLEGAEADFFSLHHPVSFSKTIPRASKPLSRSKAPPQPKPQPQSDALPQSNPSSVSKTSSQSTTRFRSTLSTPKPRQPLKIRKLSS